MTDGCGRDSAHKRESLKAGTLRLRGKGLPKQLSEREYTTTESFMQQ